MSNWQGSTRRETLPPDWEQRRLRRLRADGYRCQHVRYDTGRKCLDVANQCDHVDDRDDHSHENLQSLCEFHHQQKSSSQGGTAAARKRKLEREANKSRHPGLRY